MSHERDERDLFRRLGEDTHRAHLAPPEELRRRSDRRTASRAAIGTVAVVVAVVAVGVGANGLTGTAEPIPLGTPTPTRTPTPTPTVSSQSPPESIALAAWLDRGELRHQPGGVGVLDVLAPCGRPLVPQALVASGAVPASGTRQGSYKAPETPEVNTPDGSITQSIVLMSDEQAADQLMQDVEAAVADCPDDTTKDPGDIQYSLADPAMPTSSALPDRHVLIDVSTSFELIFGAPPDAGPDRIHTYVSVLQVGDAVTFVELRGWEASSTHPEDVQRLARLATARLLTWRA